MINLMSLCCLQVCVSSCIQADLLPPLADPLTLYDPYTLSSLDHYQSWDRPPHTVYTHTQLAVTARGHPLVM